MIYCSENQTWYIIHPHGMFPKDSVPDFANAISCSLQAILHFAVEDFLLQNNKHGRDSPEWGSERQTGTRTYNSSAWEKGWGTPVKNRIVMLMAWGWRKSHKRKLELRSALTAPVTGCRRLPARRDHTRRHHHGTNCNSTFSRSKLHGI